MNRLMVSGLVIWLCVAAGIESADAANGPEPVALPTAVEGWTWDGQEAHYDVRTVFDYIDGAGELFLAYGSEHLPVRRFEKAAQPPLTIERYRMASAEAAVGLFSFERQGEGIGIGQGSELGGGLLRLWKGRYFVSIFADGEGAEAESVILQLAWLTAAAIQEAGQPPRAIGLIPERDAGLVETSVRYVTSHILLNQRLFIGISSRLRMPFPEFLRSSHSLTPACCPTGGFEKAPVSTPLRFLPRSCIQHRMEERFRRLRA